MAAVVGAAPTTALAHAAASLLSRSGVPRDARLAAESFAYTRRFGARGRIAEEHRGAAEDLVAYLTSLAAIGDGDTDDDSAAPQAPGERWAGQDDGTRAGIAGQFRRNTVSPGTIRDLWDIADDATRRVLARDVVAVLGDQATSTRSSSRSARRSRTSRSCVPTSSRWLSRACQGGEHVRPPPKAGRPLADRLLQMDRRGLVDLANDDLPSAGVVSMLRDVAGQVVAQRPAMEALERFDPELGAAIHMVYKQWTEPRSRSGAALERLAALVCHRSEQRQCEQCGQYRDQRHSCPVRHLAATRLARQALEIHLSCSFASRTGCGLTIQHTHWSSKPLRRGRLWGETYAAAWPPSPVRCVTSPACRGASSVAHTSKISDRSSARAASPCRPISTRTVATASVMARRDANHLWSRRNESPPASGRGKAAFAIPRVHDSCHHNRLRAILLRRSRRGTLV